MVDCVVWKFIAGEVVVFAAAEGCADADADADAVEVDSRNLFTRLSVIAEETPIAVPAPAAADPPATPTTVAKLGTRADFAVENGSDKEEAKVDEDADDLANEGAE